ncbi:MAG: hypothetical protein ISP90_00890 [Nevskia sp.]|nr:hypothetical protein [Nevskia sp.]
MKQPVSRPSPEYRRLLSQVEPPAGSSGRRPLFLDEITALGRMQLVRFDHDGALKLTEKGRAALDLR